MRWALLLLLGVSACTAVETAQSATGSSGASNASTTGSSTGSTGSGALLHFGFTGDTRPDDCDDAQNYPTAVFQSICAGMVAQGVQFAVDTGDHLKVCKGDSKSDAAAAADAQLAKYAGAASAVGLRLYMTMGNHECRDNSALCDLGDPVLSTFMGYVNAAVTTETPYYAFDVGTPLGTASFVVLADTAWDAAQRDWLEAALGRADGSKYTFVLKHLPSDNTSDFSTNADELAVLAQHRVTLLLDSHAHTYVHADGSREVTLGLGGAPLQKPDVDTYGFGTVAQQPDGSLQVTIFDAPTDAPRDGFTLAPN